MASTNDVTNDRLVSKTNTQKYRDNWDKIFGKGKKDKKKDTDEK